MGTAVPTEPTPLDLSPAGLGSPCPVAGRGAVRDSRAMRLVEPMVVGLVAAGLFGLYVWLGRYWVDLIDEGYFLALAARVYDGDLPYRDFDTYYTPGVFYLYATTFGLFGVSVEPVRVLLAGVRVVWALLLYRQVRRVAPWPFATLPFLAVAAIDATPVFPEPHPAWFAMLATLVTIEMLIRHRETGQLRWAVLAGASAGAAFLFKQNVGAFAALTIGGTLLFQGHAPVGRALRVARVVFAVALALLVTTFLWPGLDELIALTLLLPLLATLGLLLGPARRGEEVAAWTAGFGTVLREGLAAGAAFVGVTLLWLAPLTLALGPAGTPFGLFVGAVNQGALVLPLESLAPGVRTLALAAIWLPIVLAAPAWLARRRARDGDKTTLAPSQSPLVIALVATLAVPLVPIIDEPRARDVENPELYVVLTTLDTQFGNLFVYLPALCAWISLALLAARARRGEALGPLPIYLLAGALAALAMYPRTDTLHVMFAGPPLLVVGAWVLSRIHRALTAEAGLATRAAVFLALLLVPTAAVAPHAYWRYLAVVLPDPRAAVQPPYVPLGLERAPVLAPRNVADNVRGAVEYVRAGTPPGAPLFAYPAVPLFNFLADRHNPTRFDHYFPGALTTEDMADVIRDLERERPRYVIWDHGGVVYWETELTNRPLSDYIWRCHEQVANFPPYLILERRGCT
jgi:hypothetical protein